MESLDKHSESVERMIQSIQRHGLSDSRVLDAMSKVPRHLFINVTFVPMIKGGVGA